MYSTQWRQRHNVRSDNKPRPDRQLGESSDRALCEPRRISRSLESGSYPHRAASLDDVMGSKMRQFRKLESSDDSTSEPHDAQDPSIADPTESQILNEQELLDLLSSDTVAVPGLSSNGGQGDNETFDLTDTFVSYNELTTTLKARSTVSQLRREAEAREDKEQNPFGDTTGIKVYPFVKT